MQVRFLIWSYFFGPKGPWPLNLNQPVRFPINISMMLLYDIFIYFAAAVFSLFCTSKVLIGEQIVILMLSSLANIPKFNVLDDLVTPLRRLELFFVMY